MTYLELKNRIAQTTHRTDLTLQMDSFSDDATDKIRSRFSMAATALPYLRNDTDTNVILTEFPLLYVYASLKAAFEHLNNGDNAIYMRDMWEEEVSKQNITAKSVSGGTDPYYSPGGSAGPPYIKWSN
jgi:hypothetical protein